MSMIPTDCNGPGLTFGGLPATQCAPAGTDTAYTLDLSGLWNPDVELPLPALQIGGPIENVDPAPPGPVQIVTGLSVPVLVMPPAVPEPSDVPGPTAWQTINTEDDASFFGLILPLEYLPVGFDTPFWLRYTSTDGNGCTAVVYGWFPNGVPDNAAEDVDVVLIAGDTVQPITIAAAPDDKTEGPATAVTVEVTSDCPPGPIGVAIGQACPEVPLTVAQRTGTVQGAIFALAEGDDDLELANRRSITLVVSAGSVLVSDSSPSTADVSVPAGTTVSWDTGTPTERLEQITLAAESGCEAIVTTTQDSGL